MPRVVPSLLLVGVAAGVGGAIAVSGCFVDVDESLLDRDAGDAGPAQLDAPAPDGASDVAPAGMPCGASRCTPGELVCCASDFGETDRTKATCVQFRRRDSDCESGDWWECMSQADCAAVGHPEQVCCATVHAGGGFSKAICQARCDAPATVLCDPASACPGGQRCMTSFEFPGLYECVP